MSPIFAVLGFLLVVAALAAIATRFSRQLVWLAKNRSWGWYVLAPWRMLLTTLGCLVGLLFCAFAFDFQKIIFLFSPLKIAGVFALVLCIGYTWSLYHLSPWFPARPRTQRLLAAVGLAVLPAGVSSLFLMQVFFVHFLDLLDPPLLAKFTSPTQPGNQIWTYDQGWLDWSISFYAQSAGHAPVRFADEDCSGPSEAEFSSAQWTNDGQLFICLNNLFHDESQKNGRFTHTRVSTQPQPTVGYDFSLQKTVVALPQAAMDKLIAAHGGLADPKIGTDVIRQNEQMPWFWELPN